VNGKIKSLIGVDKETFIEGMKAISLDNPEFLQKIFDQSDSQSGDGLLTWKEFFTAMKNVMSRSLKDKLDLFFSIVDADGNGNFSYDEIQEICEMSMIRVDGDEDDGFFQAQTDFYTKEIFRVMGYDLEDEIPVDEFKRVINHGDEDAKKLLRMFCCAADDLAP